MGESKKWGMDMSTNRFIRKKDGSEEVACELAARRNGENFTCIRKLMEAGLTSVPKYCQSTPKRTWGSKIEPVRPGGSNPLFARRNCIRSEGLSSVVRARLGGLRALQTSEPGPEPASRPGSGRLGLRPGLCRCSGG